MPDLKNYIYVNDGNKSLFEYNYNDIIITHYFSLLKNMKFDNESIP